LVDSPRRPRPAAPATTTKDATPAENFMIVEVKGMDVGDRPIDDESGVSCVY